MLINSSIGTSTVRNQGNGIAEPIRRKLKEVFHFEDFFKNLVAHDTELFRHYLKKLTDKLEGLEGESNNDNKPGIVKWGTARKCVNLVFRATVYNGFIWDMHKLKKSDFNYDGLMNKLELPLDNHVVKGIRDDCKKYDLPFDKNKYLSFRIKSLKKEDSPYYQDKASQIAIKRKVCRIDLDLCYWRPQNNCDE